MNQLMQMLDWRIEKNRHFFTIWSLRKIRMSGIRLQHGSNRADGQGEKAKDRAQLYEYISNFYTDKQNQSLIKALRRLQNEQIAREKYLFGNREFKNRVD